MGRRVREQHCKGENILWLHQLKKRPGHWLQQGSYWVFLFERWLKAFARIDIRENVRNFIVVSVRSEVEYSGKH